MFVELIIGLVAICVYLYYQLTKNRNYWKDRGVPSPEQNILQEFKVIGTLVLGKTSINDMMLEFYSAYDKDPIIGGLSFGRPNIFIRNDFDLIKAIFIKDFDHFAIGSKETASRKSTWPSTKHEKLTLNNVQSSQGEEWKNIR